MRKIFLGLILILVFLEQKAFSKDIEVYCLSINSNTVFKAFVNENQFRQYSLNNTPNKSCEVDYASSSLYLQIPKKIFDEIDKEQNYWQKKSGEVMKVEETFLGLGPKKFHHYGNDPNFIRSWNAALQTVVETKMNEIKTFQTEIQNQTNQQIKKQEISSKQTTLNKELKTPESKFSKKCEGGFFSKGHKKGTKEFDECLNKEEKLAALEEQKNQIINDEKNKKIALEENKKQKAIQQKQELDQAKVREEQIKVSKMKPEDRSAYTCSEKFGFRKGSDKFKDCVFKIYQTELELEKLELQRELAKANAETAKVKAEAARASEERQQNLARAQTEAATMQALAARQQAIAANTASSLQMIESGLRMMSPQQPAPRLQTNCYYHARSFSCF